MMKKFFVLLLALCLFCLPALAESRVTDDAGLLTAEEISALEAEIQSLRDTYQMDFALVTEEYSKTAGRAFHVYTSDYFEAHDYGWGANKDGVIFLVSLGERDYAIVTHGQAIQVFTDYGIDQIKADVAPYLSDGDYAQAFSRFLRAARQYLEHYEEADAAYDIDEPVQLLTPGERLAEAAPIVLIVALAAALITAFALKGQLKTVRRRIDAASYVRQGSFQLSRAQDIYLYTTTHRRKIETESHNNGGSGGGSSTFSSSSGGTYGGSSGKF